jgi:acetyl esterase/lipase
MRIETRGAVSDQIYETLNSPVFFARMKLSPTSRTPPLTFAALLIAVPVFLFILGALFPYLPLIGVVGTLVESFFSLHLVLAAPGRVANFAVVCALLATLGSIIPLIALMRTASRHGAQISWLDHLHVTARFASTPPDSTLLYATVGGKNLYADVYLPSATSAAKSAPVLVMHGGGYISGHRSMMRVWDRWFTARGYTVFDIDYRLAPPPTWNQAAQDAACAMVWIAANAERFHVDANRMLVAGQSAGAGLALQLAYGIGDGTVKSSCGGEPPQPKAVFALYPPDDFALGWNMKTRIGLSTARKFLTAYVGGSPEEFPERYRAISAVYHVRPGLPPMLIAAGKPDHLVPFAGHVELIDQLNRDGVLNAFLTIPYSEHAYDILWGSLGGQITRQVPEDFLQEHLPATESR